MLREQGARLFEVLRRRDTKTLKPSRHAAIRATNLAQMTVMTDDEVLTLARHRGLGPETLETGRSTPGPAERDRRVGAFLDAFREQLNAATGTTVGRPAGTR